jgi:uncharacterized protein (DUF1501 family)
MYREWPATHSVAKRLKQSAALVEDLTDRLEAQMRRVSITYAFADDEFGKRFELAYRLLAGGFPAQLIHLSGGKFDTHSGQLSDHAKQLRQFDRASHAFLKNVEELGRQVVMLVYSEFGRRVEENYSGGTDHGAGGLAWLVGNGVRGGVQGGYRLNDLRDGDLPTTVHYRSLYSTATSTTFGIEFPLADSIEPQRLPGC